MIALFSKNLQNKMIFFLGGRGVPGLEFYASVTPGGEELN